MVNCVYSKLEDFCASIISHFHALPYNTYNYWFQIGINVACKFLTIEKEWYEVLNLSPFLVFVAPLDHVKGGRRSEGDCGDYYSTTIASRRLAAWWRGL